MAAGPVVQRAVRAGSPPAVAEIRSLTGLRAVAALLVVLFHTGVVLPGVEPLELLGTAGFVGVSYFFVLSGFVLTIGHRPDESKLRFYRRRAARIMPLHLVTWVAAIAVLLLEGSRLSAKPLLANLVLLQAWIPEQSYYYSANGVSWSISCEAFFYAVMPFVLVPVLAWRTRVLVAAMTGVAVTVIGVAVVVHSMLPTDETTGLLWVFPGYRIGEFFLGVGLGVLFTRGHRWVSLRWAAIGAASTFALATGVHMALEARLPSLPPQDIASLVALPGIILLIPAVAAAERRGGGSRWLGSRLLVRIGRWSFAVYLVHQLVLRVLTEALRGEAPLGPVEGSLAQVAVAAVSVAIAAAAHRFIEKPAERRLRGSPRSGDAGLRTAEVGLVLPRPVPASHRSSLDQPTLH